jgi:hypothetical protein
VGEGLGVVAEVDVGGRVHLFPVEPERVGQGDQLVERFVSFCGSAGHGERLDEPERAGEEGAFAAEHVVLARWVAVEQRPARGQLVGDGVDGAADPLGVGGLEVEQGSRSTAASRSVEP